MTENMKNRAFDISVYLILGALTLVLVYPLYFTIIASFSSPSDVVSGNVVLWIKNFTITSYKNVFANSKIWVGYRNTIIYTVLGTILNLFITIPAAYALSKNYMWKRNFFVTCFIIPMYFSGGLLPTYLQVKNLGLLNKPYTLIILGGLSIYNLIVARTYFQSSIPDTLYEAAEIDGCSEFQKFFRIGLPLAKPVIAVITLYYAVQRWNDYYNSLIYISSSKYHSLQYVLRSILTEAQNALTTAVESGGSVEQLQSIMEKAYNAEAMKYSSIFIASLPMLILYPFVQKFFVKGVMVGAVKG